MLRACAVTLLLFVLFALMDAFRFYPVAAEDEDILWLYPQATPTPLVFSSHGEITEYVLGRYLPGTVRGISTSADGEKGIIEVLITEQVTVCYGLTDCRERDLNSTSTIEFSWATPTPHFNRDALVALYRATGGSTWMESTGWMADSPIEQWYGVVAGPCWLSGNFLRCDEPRAAVLDPFAALGPLDGGTGVTILDLRENGLVGEIPPELGRLTNLLVLDLGGNALSGGIPPELGKLTDLLVLDLGGNALNGGIPPELGTLTELIKIRLAGNQLDGCVPANLRWVPDNDFHSLGLPFCSEMP